MAYSVKECFPTLQGEGAQAGRAAVFLRFAGCNLWSGREQDRASAVCDFCDTDFRGTDGPGGGIFQDAATLASHVVKIWQAATGASAASGMSAAKGDTSSATGDTAVRPDAVRPYVVCTGGEPLLQLDAPLIKALHAQGFEIAIETNGTLAVPEGIDWICVSPKADATLVQTQGDELKLVFPQLLAPPERFADLAFRHFYLQPMDGPDRERNTARAVNYCLAHPQWRLSLQTHKLIGIP